MFTEAEKKLSIKDLDEAKILSAKELGRKVRAVRKKNTSYNQEEVSELIGTVQSAMSEIETGKYSPITLDLVNRIAIVLNTNPHELAAAYWGTDPAEFSMKDKETLDKFIKLALDYLKSLPPQLSAGQAKETRRIEDSAVHDPIADVTPDVEPPIDPGQEPTNQEPTTSSQ
jgi:DNA-binding XRE family transcriptional regulator